jgi:membrane protease YdiL (CAAX protease family)
MSVCKTCGKKYSEWISLVNTHGFCGDCFESSLSQERKAESQVDVAPALVTGAPPWEGNPHSLGGKARPQPLVPLNVLLETLGVALAVFGYRILLDLLGPASKSTVTTHGLVASSLSDLGWILLVVCLLNRSGSFRWQLPGSGKAWLMEFGWGAVLLVSVMFGKIIVFLIGTKMHLASSPNVPNVPNVWGEAFRNHSTWLAFQVLAPLSATYEELVCRVYMQSRLTQILRGHSTLVVLISSCLFTAMHGYGPLGLIGVFITGVILGASYQLNGKIPRLVIAHAANNMIGAFAWIVVKGAA